MKRVHAEAKRRRRKQRQRRREERSRQAAAAAPNRCALCGRPGELPVDIAILDTPGAAPGERFQLCEQCGRPEVIEEITEEGGWPELERRLRRGRQQAGDR